MPPAPPDALQPARVVASALLFSSLVLLALGAGLGPLTKGPTDPMVARVLASVAAGYAVLAPLIAALLTRPREDAAAAAPTPAEAARTLIFRFAVLESGVVLCALALLAGPLRWPLFAALLPLAAMVVAFPRRS